MFYKLLCVQHSCSSVYEKLFEVADIMSDAFRPFVGHFHTVLDIFLLNIIIMNVWCENSNIISNRQFHAIRGSFRFLE